MNACLKGEGMKIEWLEECVDLAETLNFTQTARNLFVSQPVLSRHISSLEQEMDLQVFTRDSHTCSLTENGARFVQDAREVVSAWRTLKEHAETMRSSTASTLTVGFLVGAARAALPKADELFSRANPNIAVKYRTCEMPETYQRLDDDLIDLAITGIPEGFDDPQYEHLALFDDTHFAIVPSDHPLAKKKEISPADLRGETVQVPSREFFGRASRSIRDYLKPEQNGIFFSEECEDMNSIPLLLHSQNCVGVSLGHLQAYYDDPYLKFIPLKDSKLHFTVAAVWKRSRGNDTIRSYAQAMKEAMGSIEMR